MRSASRRSALVVFIASAAATPALAQTLPTFEPEVLVITQERVRPGHDTGHARTESGRAAALAQAGAPDYYLAMASMTGDSEVWFIQPWAAYADWGRAVARDRADPSLSTSLERVTMADAEHVAGRRIVEAVAAPALGHGTVPNLFLVRFWSVTTLRVRPGFEDAFAAAIQVYRAAVARADPDASWRVYRVTNGLPRGTFLIFSSVESFNQFDDMATAEDAVSASMTAGERETLTRFAAEGLRRSVSNRFRLDPMMSYVSDETRAVDPGFWGGRRP